jgi:hypothetical protein
MVERLGRVTFKRKKWCWLAPAYTNKCVCMQVPTVRFMDLYVYPTSTLEIAHKEHQVHIRALGTSIEGSHHIESLNCNERFMLNLSVNLRAEDDMCASSLRLPNVRLERFTQIGPGLPPQHTRHPNTPAARPSVGRFHGPRFP